MHNFGQPPAPRTRNNLMESRPRFSPVWRSWRRIWDNDHLSPGISCSPMTLSATLPLRSIDEVEHELDDFSSIDDVRALESEVKPVEHDLDCLSKRDGADDIDFNFRYSSSKPSSVGHF